MRAARKVLILNKYPKKNGAAEGTRTPDPIITNDVLYQLSYSGILLTVRYRGQRSVARLKMRGFVICAKTRRLWCLPCKSAQIDGRFLCRG